MLCAFYDNYYVYLRVFILMRKFLYVVNVFILTMLYGLKWDFNLVLMCMYLFLWCFFILKKWDFHLVLMYMYLFLWCFFVIKNCYRGFLFGVNAYAFITMMLFMAKKWDFYIVLMCMHFITIGAFLVLKIVNRWDFFAWNFRGLSQNAAKHTTDVKILEGDVGAITSVFSQFLQDWVHITFTANIVEW